MCVCVREREREREDTEALVSDLQVPDIYSQIVSREVGGVIAVHRYRVDVVGMCIGEYPPGQSLHRDILLTLTRYPELCKCLSLTEQTFVCDSVEVTIVTTAL